MIRKDYMLVGSVAAILTINSCHLLSIYSCPSTLPTLYLHHPHDFWKYVIVSTFFGGTGFGDLESLLQPTSEEDSS